MVTMSEVAKAAGVSRATASYALRGDPRIAPATADKVMQAAKNLHYTANLSARSLRSGRNGVVGVAIFELDRPYPSEMAAAMSREAARHDMQAIVQQTSNSKADEISILRRVTSQLCDGTIFSPGNVSGEEIRALTGGKPIVLLDDASAESLFDSVDTPCVEGAEAAATHLLDIGCRNILIVGAGPQDLNAGPPILGVRKQRIAGCRRALEKAGIPLTAGMMVPMDTWDLQAARTTAHDIIESKRPVDGMFCMTDTIALGVIRGFADMGVRMPDDVAVIGFDGIAEGEYAVPSLSTVRTDLDDLARKAMGLLLRRIGGDTEPPTRLTADYELVIRESTRR